MHRTLRGLLPVLFLLACGPAFGQTTISSLPSATLPLGGTEAVPLVQSGITKQAPASAFGSGGGGGTPANPTATIGTAAVNGSASTYMRSDAAPALGSTTGSGSIVRATSPTLVTPALGTIASGVATNLTGTASGLTAGNVTTNANLTGPITSSGNATSIASQTGTGTKFVMDANPTITQPIFSGAIIASIRTTTASPVTVSATTDYVICVNTTSGATTVNLPGSPATGLQFVVKDCKGNAATSNVTVTPAAGNIDGSATYVMSTNYQAATFFFSGVQWFVF